MNRAVGVRIGGAQHADALQTQARVTVQIAETCFKAAAEQDSVNRRRFQTVHRDDVHKSGRLRKLARIREAEEAAAAA